MESILNRLDNYQKNRRLPGFIVAVIKKYSSDEAGRHAALLTYYLFLSLFPLLMVLTTLAQRLAGSSPSLEHKIVNGLTSYFPMFGNQLASDVHGLHKNGLALIIGILLTLYGSRGVAQAFGRGVRVIWGAPDELPDPFAKKALKNLILVVIGGLGFILASVSAGLAASAGHGPVFRLLSLLINAFILFWLFDFIINFSLPWHASLREVRVGAATSAIGLIILQVAGNYLLSRELKHLSALYSYFAVALGLLFWLYLQAQVLYYAMEIAVVSSKRLWPTNLTDE